MDISIIISGNLTGFSRFYASPNANDIYNEAKFDFDYRNFLTFINTGEKAYAISFSPKVIAVSLVTRILDSFRRPGILVVTALIPRYQLVSETLNAQDKSAIYRLLNEINDKFYEKNFMNGMVNQNPAVLMQDYYSEILRNYTLVSDRMQRAVNATIEVNSPNKRIGYVSTSEKDIPEYLSSLMRKSYNGYHHIFFADKAPANIDEPAKEIVTYKVRVTNDNRPIHGEVRLDDRIPNVSPQQGEMPIPNQNYTYRQILNGDAGNEIIASLENDTIILTYRFQQEEKTINFKFYDGAIEVDLPVIRPIIVEANGSSYPISTDSFTFYGKEIYGRKTIKSGNSEYTVDTSSANIDLQRFNNGATINVYVSKGWTWTFDPMINNRRVNIKPISITLVNKYTGDKKHIAHVTGYVTERLSGTAQEWEMQIESDYYKSATFPATGPYRLEPKPQPSPAIHVDHNGGNSAQGQRRGTSARTAGNTGQQVKLFGGQNDTAKEKARIEAEKKKRYIQNGIYVVVAIICCIGGWWGYTILKGDEDGSEIQPVETWETKKVIFAIEDDSKFQRTIEDENLALLDFTIDSNNNVKIEDGENRYSKSIKYKPKNAKDTITVKVTFNKIDEAEPLIFAFNRYTIDELNEGINYIVLSVKNSELTSYRELKNRSIPKDFDRQIVRLKSDSDENVKNYAMHLEGLKKEIDSKDKKPKTDATASTDTNQKIKTEDDKTKDNPKNRFSDTGLRLGSDNETFYCGERIIKPRDYEKARAEALRMVMKQLNGGVVPTKTPRALDQEQQSIINKLRKLSRQPNINSAKLQTTLKDTSVQAGSLHRIKVNIIDRQDEFLKND